MIPVAANVNELSAGQAQIDYFAIRIKSDKSGYDFLDPSAVATSPTFPASPNMPVLGSPTRANALVYSLGLYEDAKHTPKEDGSSDTEISNYEDNPDIYTNLVPFAKPNVGSANLPEWKKEDGTPRGGAVSADKLLLEIHYGGLDSVTGKVKTTMKIGYLETTSFSYTSKYGEYSKPVVKFKGIPPEANVSIPAAVFDATKVTAAARTLYRANGHETQFLPKGSGL